VLSLLHRFLAIFPFKTEDFFHLAKAPISAGFAPSPLTCGLSAGQGDFWFFALGRRKSRSFTGLQILQHS